MVGKCWVTLRCGFDFLWIELQLLFSSLSKGEVQVSFLFLCWEFLCLRYLADMNKNYIKVIEIKRKHKKSGKLMMGFIIRNCFIIFVWCLPKRINLIFFLHFESMSHSYIRVSIRRVNFIKLFWRNFELNIFVFLKNILIFAWVWWHNFIFDWLTSII